LKVEQAAVCRSLQNTSPQKRGDIGRQFQGGIGDPSQSRSPAAHPHKRTDQEVAILELLTDRRQQPLLIPISREDHIVASVSICRVEPRSEAAIGEMHARRLDIENKLKAVVGKTICQFDIFGTAKVFVEAADSQNMAPSKRGIARVKLPRRCRPISSQQSPLLLHEHLLLPADPRSHLEVFRGEQWAKHHDIPARLSVRTGVFLQQSRSRHKVVIDEDNELPNRILDARIARRSGAAIGMSKPPELHGGLECFKKAVGTVRRAVGDHDDFIGVRRVCLLLKGRDHLA
jgi:hypothetical protein